MLDLLFECPPLASRADAIEFQDVLDEQIDDLECCAENQSPQLDRDSAAWPLAPGVPNVDSYSGPSASEIMSHPDAATCRVFSFRYRSKDKELIGSILAKLLNELHFVCVHDGLY